MKAFITGVAGMIGSHLLDELMACQEVESVVGLDNLTVGSTLNVERHLASRKFTFVEGDILDEGLLGSLPGFDVVFHLAAAKKIGEANPGVNNLLINGLGSVNVFKLALANHAKVVFGSTSDCYGMSEDLPFREDGNLLLGPSMIKRWSYAVGKLYAEQLAFAYYKDNGLPVVVLRYFGGFSERASFTWSGGHIPLFIDAILKDEPCLIHGDGSQTRSMTHVDNLVQGTLRAMRCERAVGEIINIGEAEEMSVLESARLIHRLADTGRELRIVHVPFKEVFGDYVDIQRRKPDLSKAKRLLGFEPALTMEGSILKVIQARRKQLGIQP